MDKIWNVNEFKHREFQAVQAAVDACARAGGGVGAVSEGDWFSGATIIILRLFMRRIVPILRLRGKVCLKETALLSELKSRACPNIS